MNSPFKFLDAYKKEDGAVFFGRKKEIEELYDSLSGVKHLLVYGASGAGKTSLIECGLRNQFSDSDWFALTIRKGQNINASVFKTINDALKDKYILDEETQVPKDTNIDFTQAVEKLFAERYKPIYLLFDQFEELLILGEDKEKEAFFTRINLLIRYKVPCRIIFIMREEFIGHLSEYERLCPSLFQHRHRIEKMRIRTVKEMNEEGEQEAKRGSIEEVIQKMLDTPEYKTYFKVENSKGLIEKILSKLPDERREIELAHVQVFLSELWDKAHATSSQTAIPLLHEGLINENDNLEGVLDSFLQKQLKELEKEYGKDIPLEVLAVMISERHTKLQLTVAEIKKELVAKEIKLSIEKLTQLLDSFEKRRILRTLKANERTQFELSHDVLASIVGKSFTNDMQLREKAKAIYQVYLEKKNLLKQEDLDDVRFYQAYLPYPKDLETKIRESEQKIEETNKAKLIEAQLIAEKEASLRQQAEQASKTAQIRSWIAVGVAVVAILSSVFAYWQYKKTEAANEQTESAIFKGAVYLAQTQTNVRLYDMTDVRRIFYDSITKLSFSGLGLTKIPSQVSNCKNLKELDLSFNQISKLEGLDNLKDLTTFDIKGNQISKLEGLDNLKDLTTFEISVNKIRKLEGLDNLKALQSFDISFNQISKLEGLDNLKALQFFNILDNQISKLEGLDNLKALQSFYIYSNQISEEAVTALRKQHPTLKIMD